MKQSALWGLFGVEAAGCLLLRAAGTPLTGGFAGAMAFPFEQIGLGLRALSLASAAGNAAALCLYALTSLSPVIALLALRRKRALCAEDGLLALLSAVLFAVLYGMINPGLLSGPLPAELGQSVGKAMAGGVAYSVLTGYLVLRALRLSALGGMDRLARYLKALLVLLGAAFVYQAFGASVGELQIAMAALKAGNVGNEHLLGASYAFLALQCLVNALPYALNVWVVLAAAGLLDALRTGSDAADAAARLSRTSAAALAVTVLTGIGFNLAQSLFAKHLQVMHISVDIPAVPIAFALTALMLARLVAENKRLKDDNDRFI